MRTLIVEEALQTGKGHWPSYIGGLCEGMRAAGDEVEVLMHRQASAGLAESLKGTPYLSKNCWLDPASQGALGGIRHNLTFRKELASWVKHHPPYDWICALTMRLQHLLAFALLSRSTAIPKETRFLLLFVQGFGYYTGPDSPIAFPSSPSNRLASFCFRLLGPAVRAGRVVLAAETRGMQQELASFSGLPVSLFPHPVPPPPRPAPDSGNEEQRTRNQEPLAINQEQSTKHKEQVITITCPGFARHEKGNDLLQEAIRILLAGGHADRFRFVMQWPEPFAMPDGSNLGPDPGLLADPRVEFLNDSLDAEAYEALLSRTDLIVLPYRASSYHNRLSRVAIEAATRAIPLIYTKGTWTAEVADLVGGGVEIPAETPQAVTDAILEAAAKFESLKAVARTGGTQVAAFHSASGFRERLERNSSGRTAPS
jgi:glycosyltransferase involved in cell wall biosynthesis